MSDSVEQCGHIKNDGEACTYTPKYDDGKCGVHSEHNENGPGRPFAISKSNHEDILEAARMGASKAGCARAAGVDKASLLRYLDSHPDFRTAFTRARHQGEQRLLTGPLYEDKDAIRQMDGQHARFLLSTSFDYKKTEKKELEDVTDGDGFGTTIVLDSEYVDD